jgi:hypothetical protein
MSLSKVFIFSNMISFAYRKLPFNLLLIKGLSRYLEWL